MKSPVQLRALLFASALVMGIGCDHATKEAAKAWLVPGHPVSYLGDLLRFDLVRNPGAFMSLGAGLDPEIRQWLFLGVAPLALVLLVAWFVGTRSTAGPQLLGLGLITGGGLGNWLDRLLHAGAVTDFLSLGIGPVRSGIFNLADVWIVCGVLLLAWTLREPDPEAT